MTKKKRGHPAIDELLSRPWCFYCERDFDDLKILINHQKAKHFKCERCGRRLNTAGGLSVHMNQVHKENLGAIENALPNRAGLDVEIFGMEGIPDEIVQQHNQRVLTQFHQTEAERRAATGNPVPGSSTANGAKKPKFESPADLKKRLAEHKAAKLAAEQNGGGSSGAATPSSTSAQLAAPEPSTSYPVQSYSQLQSYAPPPSSTTFGAPQTYQQPPTSQYPPQGYPGFAQSNGYPAPSPQSPFGPPAFQTPYNQPPQPYQQMPPAFSPPPPFQPMGSFPPAHQYPPQVPQNGYQSPVGAPRAFNSASPASSFPPQQQRTHSPAHQSGQSRAPSTTLPTALGLPQRPVVSAPSVNQAQFQQMHHGQNPVSGLPSLSSHGQQQTYSPAEYNPAAPHVGMPRSLSRDEKGDSTALDQLISDAQRPQSLAADMSQADKPAALSESVVPDVATSTPAKPETVEAKSTEKKDTDKKVSKATRLVYSDNEVSPEEKMAALPRYAFNPRQQAAQS